MQQAVPSGRDGANNSLQLEGTHPHMAADGAPFGSHLQSLAELLTPHQACPYNAMNADAPT
jgi:hypothetical protein